MRYGKETLSVSKLAWAKVGTILATGVTAESLAARLGYASCGSFQDSLRRAGGLPVRRRSLIDAIYAGEAPESEAAKDGGWDEFSLAAGMAHDTLLGIVGNTPKAILHPKVSLWLDQLADMKSVSI